MAQPTVRFATDIGSTVAEAVTVTLAARSGLPYKIYSIHAGFGAPDEALLTITDSTTTFANIHVQNQRDINFDPPIEMPGGTACVVSMAAGADQLGSLTVTYS